MINNSNPILLVDDDDVDVITVQRYFKKLNISNPLLIANNGEKALDILETSNIVKPSLILLDINMPRMNGLELLTTLKAHPDFKVIPVIMLTSSREESDIQYCFSNSVAGYIVKPIESKDFESALKSFEAYWSLSELP